VPGTGYAERPWVIAPSTPRSSPAAGPHPAASTYDNGVGAALGVGRFGIYQVELPPGAETVEHDHTADEAEDVYAVLQGSGAVIVDGEEVPVHPGMLSPSNRHRREASAPAPTA
jgi:uncharacterized cupin superfamily protein